MRVLTRFAILPFSLVVCFAACSRGDSPQDAAQQADSFAWTATDHGSPAPDGRARGGDGTVEHLSDAGRAADAGRGQDSNTSMDTTTDDVEPAPQDSTAQAETSSQEDAGGSGCNGECPTGPNVCVVACQTAADCPYPGVAAGGVYDANNWECQEGRCQWMGCLNDAECAADPSFDYAPTSCVSLLGGFTKSCLADCATPADCPMAGVTDFRYDADNYACKDGHCSWEGCKSDAECAASLGATGKEWKCADNSWGFPVCTMTCKVPADCVYIPNSAMFDSNNYECNEGFCRHLGCLNDAECAEVYAYAEQDYVCAENFVLTGD
jgi:hypothetical protein